METSIVVVTNRTTYDGKRSTVLSDNKGVRVRVGEGRGSWGAASKPEGVQTLLLSLS